jgi:hypothetical protein
MVAKISISVADRALLEWAKEPALRDGVSVSAVFTDAVRCAQQHDARLRVEKWLGSALALGACLVGALRHAFGPAWAPGAIKLVTTSPGTRALNTNAVRVTAGTASSSRGGAQMETAARELGLVVSLLVKGRGLSHGRNCPEVGGTVNAGAPSASSRVFPGASEARVDAR